jgi:hypothetical protein
MAWTDTCKIEAVNQVKRLEKEAGGVRAAIRQLSAESGIPYSTLDQWVYPRKQSDVKINVPPLSAEKVPTNVGDNTFLTQTAEDKAVSDQRYNALNQKLETLRTDWVTLKDSDDPVVIADFYRRSNALLIEAKEYSLDAEAYLGDCLNAIERVVGCGLLIWDPSPKVWWLLITPTEHSGYYFRTHLETDDFDGGSIVGDTRGISATILNLDRLIEPGHGESVVIEPGHELAGPWKYNKLLYSSYEEYRAKRLDCGNLSSL